MEKGIYLLKLEIENVGCFGENAVLNLSDEKGNWQKWTVVLGNNGTGKTTLLKIISPLELKEDDYNGQKSYSANTSLVFFMEKIF